MSESGQPQTELDQVFLEYLRHVDQHGIVDPQDILEAHPHLAGELQALIETASRVKHMAGPRLDAACNPTADSSHTDAAFAATVVVPAGQAPEPAPAAGGALVGTQLGDYLILEELGRGGMGVVYKARQTGMGREVALKMIRSGCLATRNDVQRFYLEARAAGRLNHPSIVDVYQVGEIDGQHFFSMEYVAGKNLAAHVRDRNLSFTEIANLLRQVAEAVDFAHQHGVLHRDLKPSNVLVDAGGCPRITDFGLAKDMESGQQLTSSGSTVGTPNYMPPEQAEARRDEITCRSDVYSLGAILYALLTGGPPFRADSLVETLMAVIHDDPVAPREHNPECPPDLEAICLMCLRKDPAGRYATAHDLAEDLAQFVRGESVSARRSRLHRRAWRWLRNVPLVAAVVGRKNVRPTRWQVRSQWISLALVILVIAGAVWWPGFVESRRLATVEISTGPETGRYDAIGRDLASRLRAAMEREVTAVQTAGAVDSHDRLLAGDVDLAFLQENALQAHGLTVLAPLYREATLVLVRRDAGITAISELPGHRIALGPTGSGMRLSSRRLLEYYGVPEDQLLDVDRAYSDLADDARLQGAIVTIEARTLRNLAWTSGFRVLPLENVNDIPGLRTMRLQEMDEGQEGLIPREGILVPATFAILAVREQTPDWFVVDCLDALYGEDGLASGEIFTLQEAAAWTDLNYHPAAERYFRAARGDP